MRINNLYELYVEGLRDLYSAETITINTLPRIMESSTDPELERAILGSIWQTKRHIARLDKIFYDLRDDFAGPSCQIISGIFEKMNYLSEGMSGALLDITHVVSLQKVQHCKIAMYGSSLSIAAILAFEQQAVTLKESIEEEVEAAIVLTRIVDSAVHLEAAKHSGVMQALSRN